MKKKIQVRNDSWIIQFMNFLFFKLCDREVFLTYELHNLKIIFSQGCFQYKINFKRCYSNNIKCYSFSWLYSSVNFFSISTS